MSPGFYIPAAFVKSGIWLEECSPEIVPALCHDRALAAAGSLSAGLPNEHGCHLSLPTGIINDRAETAQKGNRTGTRFM